MPRGGMVTLQPSTGSQLTMILNGAPERGGGVGGWQPSERALRRPGKWWQAYTDDTLSLDCTIDIDAIGGPSVERRLRVLRNMGLPGDDDSDPPVITVIGDLWEDDQNVRWVMTDMTWGDPLFNTDGTLRRQQVTVALERFNEITEIAPLRIKSTRSGTKRRRRTVVSKGGDTLRTIALRELGSVGRWADLRKWNAKLKKVDPDARLRPGTHVVVK